MADRASAQQMFNAGREALNNRDKYPQAGAHAYKMFASACFADPTWGTAFYQAGNNNIDLKLAHAAIACYRRALECNPEKEERAKILTNMGWQLQALGQTQEALSVSREALRVDPALAQPHLNLSVIYRDLADSEKSLYHAQAAFKAENKADYEVALAFACLFDGQYARGLKHFERRFEWRLKHFQDYPYPRWDGAPGKTVLLVADQGLGDTLCYARFIRQLCQTARYVHVVCQHELLRLFQHAFADIQNLNLIPGLNAHFPAADGWTTFVSLPFDLKLPDSEIISAPPVDAPRYGLPTSWRVPDRKFHVGIAWGGSPLNDIDAHRNIPVQLFYELYRVSGVQLYSLQVNQNMQGHDGQTVNKWNDLAGSGGAPLIQDLSPYIHDVVDTMSLINSLDLVITAETALGHICATINKECWIPYSRLGKDYRAGLIGEKKLWCPRTTFFMQDSRSSWEPVFENIVDMLPEYIDARIARAA